MIPEITIYPFLLDSVSNVIKVEKAIQMCGTHRAGGESQYNNNKKILNTYIWEEEMIQKKKLIGLNQASLILRSAYKRTS